MGSTHKTIYMPDIETLTTPLPPLPVQRAIARLLDAETARIDAVIAARTRQVLVLDELEQSVIDHVFVSLAAATTRLGRLAHVQTGLTIDGARSIAPDDVEAPYLRVANVQHGWLDLDSVTNVRVSASLAARSKLEAGDVLMTEGGDLDKLGRGTVWRGEIAGCLHQNHVFAVRPGRRLESRFLAHFTRTSQARAHFESTGVQTTNLASTSASKVRDLLVPVAAISEQVDVAGELDRRLADLSAIRHAIKESTTLLQERKQALITAAVTGQLDLARSVAEMAS